MNNTSSIKRFIVDYPGHFDGESAGGCLDKALAAYRVAMHETAEPEFFAAVLCRHGYKPEQVRDARGGAPALYRLALPSRPVTDHSNAGALRRIAGDRN